VGPELFLVQKADGIQWEFLDLDKEPGRRTFGASESVLLLGSDQPRRVVVKHLKAEAAYICWMALTTGADCPYVLQPLTRIAKQGSHTQGCYVAYPFCENGTIEEWVRDSCAAGLGVPGGIAAKIVFRVLRAGQTLIARKIGISALTTSEIFLDSSLIPLVRLGHERGTGAEFHDLFRGDATSKCDESALVSSVGLVIRCLANGVTSVAGLPVHDDDDHKWAGLLSLSARCLADACHGQPALSEVHDQLSAMCLYEESA